MIAGHSVQGVDPYWCVIEGIEQHHIIDPMFRYP
ncbi:Uncharacterised protein [Mycobacteroides abscessus subsp. abscessus]|nr:Uncharacterised protein [Mycobacteroides abscessus subsp. abscessus]SKT61276.1 Uncharacterised protein [Mycobacteroides abscessus subsp. abscessus]